MQAISVKSLSKLLQADTVVLPRSRKTVEVVTLLRREHKWVGSKPLWAELVPNKPLMDFGGEPTWAEFILLRLLEANGWSGAWVKNWGGRDFWANPGKRIQLSTIANSVFQRLEKCTANGSGCWDIVAQRGDDVLFIEAKKKGKDALNLNQKSWLEAALENGVSLSSFAIAEWYALAIVPRSFRDMYFSRAASSEIER
jgi:hypothetical protein